VIPNFHTHTYLCKHAEGTVADYVAAAISSGCSALGFSDHCPYPEDKNDTWPGIRMFIDEGQIYVKEIKEAAKKAPFPVYSGFECEYDKRYHNWYAELRQRFNLDYLVLGPHWVDVYGEFVYAPQLESSKDVHRYFDNMIQAISSGLFNFVAHPDLIMADGRCWTEDLAACFSAVIEAAMDCNMPLEINGAGLSRQLVIGEHGLRKPYPMDQFWELVVKKGAKVVCNSDAHRPCDVIAFAVATRKYAEKFGIKPLDTIF